MKNNYTKKCENIEMVLKNKLIIDDATGELLDLKNVAYDIVNATEDKQHKARVYSSYSKIIDNNKAIKNVGGNYYHMMFNKILNDNFEENYAIRFMMLCTYLNYENKLIIGETSAQRKIRESDLEDILKLKRTECWKTKEYLLEKGLIFIDEYGIICVNKEYCVKGAIKGNAGITRVFENGFRELYNGVSARQHNILFTFIKVLPYLNKEYNILCENPDETDISLIKPLKWSALGDKIGLNNEQSKKLKAKLFKLKINNKYVVAKILNEVGKKIVINPAIFWKSNVGKIDKIAMLFEC